MRLLYSNSGGVDSCSLPLVRVCLELGRRMFCGDVLGRRHLCGLSSCEGDGSNLLPRELFLLRWRLCRRRQTPVPVTGVFSSVMADRLLLFLDLDDESRCDWETVYSASMPSSKSSSAVSSTSWGSRRVAWASCSFGRCASSPTPADSEEVRCPGAMREDPRTLFLNLNGLRVLYANLHLWGWG